MIPKIIHYCWFGCNPLPELAVKCIESWKKFCPDYEIKEWNESNFDLHYNDYVWEAYQAKKWAFITDVVRLYALSEYGGVYMDTDVEVIKPLDPFLRHVAFSGYENEHDIPTGIIASEKRGKWVMDNLHHYDQMHFLKSDGSFNMTTNVVTLTNYMLPLGLKRNNTYQDFPGLITFYPKDYFCPKSYFDGKIYLTDNTVTIHHFAGSWRTEKDIIKYRIMKFFGPKIMSWWYDRKLRLTLKTNK